MKKLILTLIISVSAMLIAPLAAYAGTADNELITDGSYVQMGTYNDEPILWRCVSTSADDDNGKLIVSDRILCYKCFDAPIPEVEGEYWYKYGCSHWEDSTIRAWLNSTLSGGNIVWPANNPPTDISNPYNQEDGFLSTSNFSAGELSAMKSVSQWQILTAQQDDEVTNGIHYFFQTNRISDTRNELIRYGSISELSHVEGGMKKIVDTVFLLDEPQAYRLYMKYDALSTPTDKALQTWKKYPLDDTSNVYWLRSPWGNESVNYVKGSNGYLYTSPFYGDRIGIRPAFYLNEDNVRVLSGSGEWYDPYVIDGYGQSGIKVFSQSKQVQLSQQPIVEDGSVLVPVRDVYESLGAYVEYDTESQIITANNGNTIVVMEIGNPELGNGTEVIDLDPAPQMVNGTAMVTLEAIDESFNANVEYLEELNRVVIDIPQEQDFGDGVGIERWQQWRNFLN